MLNRKHVNMTEGPIFPAIVVYSIPIVLSSIMQILFNAADLAVVGNFAGTVATAAVGATTSFISLIVNSVMGLTTGVNVTLARAIGARDRDASQRIVHTAVTVSVIAGVIVGVIGFLVSPFAMDVTRCPESAKDMAVLYMRIYFCGAPGIFLYNFGAAILRTKGDTRRPLNFLILSGVLNVILNLIFVIVLKMEADGVALATAISQYVAAGLVLKSLTMQDDETRVNLQGLRITGKELAGILRYGLPSGFTSAMYSFSNLQIQSAINSFGDSAVAGSAACTSLEGFISSGTTAISSATLSFVGQNIGAQKKERIGRVVLCGLCAVLLYTVTLGVGMYLIGTPLYRIYVPNDLEAIRVAALRARYMVLFNWMMGVFHVFGSASEALGYSIRITVNSVLGVCGVRTLWMQFIYPHIKTLDAVYICYPITWGIIILAHGVVLTIAYRRYMKKGTVR